MYEDKRGAIEEMLSKGLLPTELQEQVFAVFRTWKFEQVKPNDLVEIRVA